MQPEHKRKRGYFHLINTQNQDYNSGAITEVRRLLEWLSHINSLR